MPQRFRPWFTDSAVRRLWLQQLAAASVTPGRWRELRQHAPELLPRFAAWYRRLRALPRRLRRSLQRQWASSLTGVALLFTLQPTPSWAANFTAATAKELIAAIKLANATPVPDTITLTANILLTTPATPSGVGLPIIFTPITIVGNGHSIARNRRALPFGILAVGQMGNLTLQGTKVSGGWTLGNGGGISNNHGTVTLIDSIVVGNVAERFGGGISNNHGTVTLTNSVVSGNVAGFGGGVYNYQGTMTLTNSIVSGNHAAGAHNGGGIFTTRGVVTLLQSTVSTNTAGHEGGGVRNDGGTLMLTNSAVSDNSARRGGGIYNDFGGIVTLTDSMVSGNVGRSSVGGILNRSGDLTLTASTVSNNSAVNQHFGSGVSNYGGTARLTESTVSGNSADGLFNGGDLTLTNSTVSGNSGWGVINYGRRATITNSTVSGNAGGGVRNSAVATITNSTVSGNAGGGVFNNAALTLTNSTVSGNSTSGDGGGIFNLGGIGVYCIPDPYEQRCYCFPSPGKLTLTNCTVSGNTAGGRGGGVYNGIVGELTLNTSTVTGNSAGLGGGGIRTGTDVSCPDGRVLPPILTLNRSLISGNTAPVLAELSTRPLTSSTAAPSIRTLSRSLISGNTAPVSAELNSSSSNGYNLLGHIDLTTSQAFDFTSASDITATSDGTKPTALTAILDPALADNGGATDTHNLVAGSPAIDAVPADANCPATDQRGAPRPFGPKCDIGAVEFGATPPSAFSGFLPPPDAPDDLNIVKEKQNVPSSSVSTTLKEVISFPRGHPLR